MPLPISRLPQVARRRKCLINRVEARCKPQTGALVTLRSSELANSWVMEWQMMAKYLMGWFLGVPTIVLVIYFLNS